MLSAQPGPQEKREGQHQQRRAGVPSSSRSEVFSFAVDRRVHVFAAIADATFATAPAPAARLSVSGKGDCTEGLSCRCSISRRT